MDVGSAMPAKLLHHTTTVTSSFFAHSTYTNITYLFAPAASPHLSMGLFLRILTWCNFPQFVIAAVAVHSIRNQISFMCLVKLCVCESRYLRPKSLFRAPRYLFSFPSRRLISRITYFHSKCHSIYKYMYAYENIIQNNKYIAIESVLFYFIHANHSHT